MTKKLNKKLIKEVSKNMIKALLHMFAFNIISFGIWKISTIGVKPTGEFVGEGLLPMDEYKANLFFVILSWILFLIVFLLFYTKYFKKDFKKQVEINWVCVLLYVLMSVAFVFVEFLIFAITDLFSIGLFADITNYPDMMVYIVLICIIGYIIIDIIKEVKKRQNISILNKQLIRLGIKNQITTIGHMFIFNIISFFTILGSYIGTKPTEHIIGHRDGIAVIEYEINPFFFVLFWLIFLFIFSTFYTKYLKKDFEKQMKIHWIFTLIFILICGICVLIELLIFTAATIMIIGINSVIDGIGIIGNTFMIVIGYIIAYITIDIIKEMKNELMQNDND